MRTLATWGLAQQGVLLEGGDGGIYRRSSSYYGGFLEFHERQSGHHGSARHGMELYFPHRSSSGRRTTARWATAYAGRHYRLEPDPGKTATAATWQSITPRGSRAMRPSVILTATIILAAFKQDTSSTRTTTSSAPTPIDTSFVGNDAQFDTPIKLNAVDPQRLLVGGYSNLYESIGSGRHVCQPGPSWRKCGQQFRSKLASLRRPGRWRAESRSDLCRQRQHRLQAYDGGRAHQRHCCRWCRALRR